MKFPKANVWPFRRMVFQKKNQLDGYSVRWQLFNDSFRPLERFQLEASKSI